MSISRYADFLYAIRFLRLLTTKWEKTNAYKHGIIDKNGVQLIKSKNIPPEHKKYYNVFHKLVFNIKRLLQKTPIVGKSILTNYAAGLLMLKEHLQITDSELSELLESANISFQLDEQNNILQVGQEITTQEPLICLESFDENIKENSKLVVEQYVDTVLSVPVFLAREISTGSTTYISVNENISVSTGNVGSMGQPLPVMKKRKYTTIDVDDEVFSRMVNPKVKYKHWKNYISKENDSYSNIKKCVQRGDMVVLRNSQGAACIVRNYKNK